MPLLLRYIDFRSSRLLNPDWSIKIPGLPAVCKEERNHMHAKPCNSFFMVGVAWFTGACAYDKKPSRANNPHLKGRRRHPAVLHKVHIWHWTAMLWSIHTCQNKVSVRSAAHRGQVFLNWLLIRNWFTMESQAQAGLMHCNDGLRF